MSNKKKMAKNIIRLKSKFNDDNDKKVILSEFSKLLRQAIKFSDLDEYELSERIGISRQQISRYLSTSFQSNKQMPRFLGLRKICTNLQIDPSMLMGLEWVDCESQPKAGTIYLWRLKYDFTAVYWLCPKCEGKNITYGNWAKNDTNDLILDVDKLKDYEYMCEYSNCSEFYENLYNFNFIIGKFTNGKI